MTGMTEEFAARRDAKRAAFAALHQRDGAFVLANAWDDGSARVLAGLGAEALASTSAGWAFTLGRPDGTGDLESALAHAAALDAATPLPVNADLEDGYGASPEAAALCVRKAAEAGIAGCSIEDVRLGEGTVYDFDEAVARVAAAVEAAKAAGTPEAPFTFTARADGVMIGAYDLDEAIRRLQAFEAAGADVLYAPVPGDLAALEQICASVSKPVNALAVGPYAKLPIADLAAAGARRISLGSLLARITHGALASAAERILAGGPSDPDGDAASGRVIDALMEKGAG